MTTTWTKEEAEAAVHAVAKELDIKAHGDKYFFLARLGDNYSAYQFNWEPFRDLAGGSLQGSESSIPVFIVSDDEQRDEPLSVRENTPLPHYRFRVSPSVPAAVVADAWLQLVREDGAHLRPDSRPCEWFVEFLGLRVADISPASREFLLLE